jgi:hypothetical protein
MQFRRANEKLLQAVTELAVGVMDARGRVASAYVYLRCLTSNDLPPTLVNEWRSILKATTRYGPLRHDDGEPIFTSVQNTMKRSRNKTASEIARRIFALYRDLQEIRTR